MEVAKERGKNGARRRGDSINRSVITFRANTLRGRHLAKHRNSDPTNLEPDYRKKVRACTQTKMTAPLVPRNPGQGFSTIHLAICVVEGLFRGNRLRSFLTRGIQEQPIKPQAASVNHTVVVGFPQTIGPNPHVEKSVIPAPFKGVDNAD
ncbi:hypothetical protein CA54_08500 [Symmachiella macrocystis]|uniref:Uncharacterized protein n=1 Tax=Symmachiella macrocystis TaxID=2527985 RepID=A0A5C6BNB5_9PLAN|nr:hypothetical protein CA54_08500 [Symmachiella macrocystis]